MDTIIISSTNNALWLPVTISLFPTNPDCNTDNVLKRAAWVNFSLLIILAKLSLLDCEMNCILSLLSQQEMIFVAEIT